MLTLAITAGLGVWQWGENVEIVERALAMDDLTLALTMIFCAAGIAAVFMSWRSAAAAEAGEGEFYALMLTSVLGMVVLVAAQNTVVLFVGFELLSIPLYVLCATHMRREHSLESGLKYLIIGSVGSATLLYGLALVYGATGATAYADIAEAASGLQDDVLLLTGVALVVTGLAFKASVAPFHQWTPDVYEGAPTPVTAFMAVATKAAAFGVLLRFFDVALIDLATTWGPALAVLAVDHDRGRQRGRARAVVAQAHAGLLVGRAGRVHARRRRGVDPARHRRDGLLPRRLRADEPRRVRGDHGARARVGRRRRHLRPLRAGRRPALAGVADDDRDAVAGGHAGDRRVLRQALPDPGGRRERLRRAAVAIVLGSAISLAYYLRVVAAVWMRSPSEAVAARAVTPGGRPIMAGGASGDEPGSHAAGLPERRESAGVEPVEPASDGPLGRRLAQPELAFVAIVCAVATVFFGLYPEPLFDIAQDAGAVLRSLV